MYYSIRCDKLSSSVLKSHDVNNERLLTRNLTIY
jgi:hypothetical protein